MWKEWRKERSEKRRNIDLGKKKRRNRLKAHKKSKHIEGKGYELKGKYDGGKRKEKREKMLGVLVVCRTGALCLEGPSLCLDAPAGLVATHRKVSPLSHGKRGGFEERVCQRRARLSALQDPGQEGDRRRGRRRQRESTTRS